MPRRLTLFTLLALLLVASLASLSPAGAQGTEPTPTVTDPNAQISWPPPVYVLRGEVGIRGTADVANMANYFLEYRPLDADMTAFEDADDVPWFPATLPTTGPVQDDVLGVWDTRLTEDGLYELRLTVNVARSAPVFYLVTPLRVENEPPDFVDVDEPVVVGRPNLVTPTPIRRATLAATPTAFTGQPIVTARVDANVRLGDNTSYERIGFLRAGDSAEVIGISASGSGWYYVQLDTGRRGFISPSTVSFSGDSGDLQRITPPATPTPTATPTPPATGNLLISGTELIPDQPRCGQNLEVRANVTNNGQRATSGAVNVRLENRHIASGTVTNTANAVLPALNPGENFVVVFNINVNQFPREDHRLIFTVDSGSQVLEENEGDNVRTLDYRLRAGSCP